MKGSSIKRKPAKKKARPADPCWWSNRCKTRAPVVVGGDERYCKTHAMKLAERLVGLAVKERDDWTCQACGSTDAIQWAHVISRGAPYIKYDPENSMALCAKDHLKFTLEPAKWSVWLETNRPGLYLRMVHREMEGERSGHEVDLGEIIHEFRAATVAGEREAL